MTHDAPRSDLPEVVQEEAVFWARLRREVRAACDQAGLPKAMRTKVMSRLAARSVDAFDSAQVQA